MGKPTATRKLTEKPDNQLKKVRRCLFGKPNPTDTKKFLQDQINRIHERNKSKWNFDFEKDTPLPGRYTWHIIQEKNTTPKISPLISKTTQKITNSIQKPVETLKQPVLTCSGYFKHKTPKGARITSISSPPVKPTPGSASKRHSLRTKTSTPKRSVLRSSEHVCLVGSNSPLGQGNRYPVLSPGIIEHAGLQTSITGKCENKIMKQKITPSALLVIFSYHHRVRIFGLSDLIETRCK